MTKQTVSAIITNYNHGEFLYHSVRNLVRQTRKLDEIIIVDDGSTDHSRDVLEVLTEEHPELIVILSDRNQGVNAAVRTGLARATGSHITTLGADDPVTLVFFERALALHARHPEMGFCSGEYQLIYPKVVGGIPYPISIGLSEHPRYFSPPQLSEAYRIRNDLSVPTAPAVWRRAVWDEVGGMQEELRWLSDWFAALVAVKRHGYGYIPGVMQSIRYSAKSYSSSGMAESDAYVGLIRRVLGMLERPEYSDMQSFFQLPAVLSRFGFKLLNILIEESRYQKYLSHGLITAAIKCEKINLEIDTSALKSIRGNEIVGPTRHLLAQCAIGIFAHVCKLKRMGCLTEATEYCRKALDANRHHEGAAATLEELEAKLTGEILITR